MLEGDSNAIPFIKAQRTSQTKEAFKMRFRLLLVGTANAFCLILAVLNFWGCSTRAILLEEASISQSNRILVSLTGKGGMDLELSSINGTQLKSEKVSEKIPSSPPVLSCTDDRIAVLYDNEIKIFSFDLELITHHHFPDSEIDASDAFETKAFTEAAFKGSNLGFLIRMFNLKESNSNASSFKPDFYFCSVNLDSGRTTSVPLVAGWSNWGVTLRKNSEQGFRMTNEVIYVDAYGYGKTSFIVLEKIKEKYFKNDSIRVTKGGKSDLMCYSDGKLVFWSHDEIEVYESRCLPRYSQGQEGKWAFFSEPNELKVISAGRPGIPEYHEVKFRFPYKVANGFVEVLLFDGNFLVAEVESSNSQKGVLVVDLTERSFVIHEKDKGFGLLALNLN